MRSLATFHPRVDSNEQHVEVIVDDIWHHIEMGINFGSRVPRIASLSLYTLLGNAVNKDS